MIYKKLMKLIDRDVELIMDNKNSISIVNRQIQLVNSWIAVLSHKTVHSIDGLNTYSHYQRQELKDELRKYFGEQLRMNNIGRISYK